MTYTDELKDKRDEAIHLYEALALDQLLFRAAHPLRYRVS